MHAASLGEFEQGLPVIEKLKVHYPSHKILITFFSPSGYEVKKNTKAADVVVYLPIDTFANAKKFIAITRPELAIFVKYELWPNYLRVLQAHSTPTLLVSAIFNKKQIYFKWYGGFMRKALGTFSQIFVQDNTSVALLNNIGYKQVLKSGDTRFDRVSKILRQNNRLDFMDKFVNDHKCLVAGSTWPQDEEILVDYINGSELQLKYVLAPHNIKKEHIETLRKSISKKVLLYSEIREQDLTSVDVMIIDTIGLLTKIYSYANLAYVGGAFATGLHNTLEPAVFGIPVLIGPEYEKFNEAKQLVENGGILVVQNSDSFTSILSHLIENPELLRKTGEVNSAYIEENKGASIQIVEHIRRLL